jgi:hypothetical protein
MKTQTGGDESLGAEPAFSIARASAKNRHAHVQAILRDESVGVEFMTDNVSEADEMREQCLTFDCVGEVRILDEPGWVKT